MIRLLRHRHDPSIPREDDGAVRFDDIMEKIKAKFDGTSQWPINDWITCLAKGGGPKKRFQYCLNPNSSKHFLYFRAIQGHSGSNLVDPALHRWTTIKAWKKFDATWRPRQNTVYWCNLMLAQEKGLQFYQTRSHAYVLYNTLPAICIEKAVCMKTKEELYHKVFQSPRLPRVIQSRIHKVDNRINMSKKQENSLTTKAYREGTGKPQR